MIMLGTKPSDMHIATDGNIIEAMRGRGQVELQLGCLKTGCRIFARDGSGLIAWIPFFEGQSEHRDLESVWDWLEANEIDVTCIDDEPKGPLWPHGRPIALGDPKQPEPGTQGGLF